MFQIAVYLPWDPLYVLASTIRGMGVKRTGPPRSRQIGSLRAIGGSERGTRSLASNMVCYCICTLHDGRDSWVLIGSINR